MAYEWTDEPPVFDWTIPVTLTAKKLDPTEVETSVVYKLTIAPDTHGVNHFTEPQFLSFISDLRDVFETHGFINISVRQENTGRRTLTEIE